MSRRIMAWNRDERREPEGAVAGGTHKLRTVKEAALDLSVSEHTVRAWVATRKIGSVRLGRSVRIPAAEIERLVERGTVPALDERGRPITN
jgi:excisionase family DNA binding protein